MPINDLRPARWTFTFVVFACLSPAIAQNTAIQAELSQNLAGDHLKVGSLFSLQVMAPWRQGECHLTPGALLHAAVETITRSQSGHAQGITFTLDAPCGDLKPIELVVTSLVAQPKIEEIDDSFPGFGRVESGSFNSIANFDPSSAMRSTPQVVNHTKIQRDKLPQSVALGEVWHLPHITLVLPSGDGTSSAITTGKSELTLPAKTIFILQSGHHGEQALRVLPIGDTDHALEVPRSATPFLGPCRAGSCKSYSAPLITAGFGFKRAGDVQDLTSFGLKAEHDREVTALELSATVHFVGDQEVLVTFPTHELVRRTRNERPTDNPQAIRAVLLNTKTRSVNRVEHWIIDDRNAYIWPFGQHLLVHEGRSLKVYGPGLMELAFLPLDLPLASLRVSPDGKHLIVGELRELHSNEDHQTLVETNARGPKEEVHWSLLDGDLKYVRGLGTSSNFVPTPILLNNGMIELRKGMGSEWFLVGRTWDSSADKQLGSLRSSCPPTLDSVSPDLLAATICDRGGRTVHTFLVRANGAPVIDQTSTLHDLPVAFAGSSDPARVALMITQASDDYDAGRLFRFSSIKSQTIEVFESGDGSLLASMSLPQIVHFRQAFALSPDGVTLALLTENYLTLYEIQP